VTVPNSELEPPRPQPVALSPAWPRTVVVVPCYEEAKRLDVPAFERFLREKREILLYFVDDGSKDATGDVLQRLADTFPLQVRVLSLPSNRGKAEAVRAGVVGALEHGASYVGYWDADLATPLDAIVDFERRLDTSPELDIVLGARVALLGHQIERSMKRHYLGRVFATAAAVTLNLPVYDTQCGAKLLRVNPRTGTLFAEPFLSRWIFDVELLARYLQGGGSADGLYEYALPRWADVGGSRLTTSDFVRAGGEMMRIYRRFPLGQPLRGLVVPLTGAFSRYVAAGGLGTALHYLVLVSGVEQFGLHPGVGAGLGATVGAGANYLLNYHLTFTSRVLHRRALPRFLLVAALGALLSGFGVKAGVELGVHYFLAQVTCTVAFLILGFLLNRAWTF